VLRHGRRVPVVSAAQLRTLAAAPQNGLFHTQTESLSARLTQKRLFSASRVLASAGAAQPAPDPKAYLSSGVIKPREHIDVKKVIVIGSGGLAIGQAGEFDYSGMSVARTSPPLAVNNESREHMSRERRG
jgi:carbamoyl-phosphate synthase large subunit